MAKCPVCDGAGGQLALVDGTRNGRRAGWPMEIPCTICTGSGTITEERALWIREGRDFRAGRIRQGLTVSAMAARIGLSVDHLVRCERGQQDPNELREALRRHFAQTARP